MSPFPGLKGFVAAKWCDFLNSPDCSCCSFTYLRPLIHITDEYLSKNVTELKFCEITNSHPYYTGSVFEVIGQKYCDIYSFYHLRCYDPLKCKTSCQSQPTYMITNFRYRPLIASFILIIQGARNDSSFFLINTSRHHPPKWSQGEKTLHDQTSSLILACFWWIHW